MASVPASWWVVPSPSRRLVPSNCRAPIGRRQPAGNGPREHLVGLTVGEDQRNLVGRLIDGVPQIVVSTPGWTDTNARGMPFSSVRR